MKKMYSLGIAAVAAVGLLTLPTVATAASDGSTPAPGSTAGAAAPAKQLFSDAPNTDQSDAGGWGILQGDGTVLPMTDEYNLTDPPPDQSGGVTPQLIDPGQYALCWGGGWEGLNFANYQYPWNGEMVTISLLCGTDSYGYRHISNGKKTDWANVQVNAGDDSGQSWDDVMSFANFAALVDPLWPGFVGPGAANKMCSLGRIAWFPNGDYTQPPSYTHRVKVIWSYNNSTIITSYPIGETGDACDLSKL